MNVKEAEEHGHRLTYDIGCLKSMKEKIETSYSYWTHEHDGDELKSEVDALMCNIDKSISKRVKELKELYETELEKN